MRFAKPVKHGRPGRPIWQPNRFRAAPHKPHKRIQRAIEAKAKPIEQSLLSSETSRGISLILHVIAAVSFAIISGYASAFLLMTGFWTGAVIGLIIYGAMMASTWLPEDDAF